MLNALKAITKKMSDHSVFDVQKAIENICGSDVKNTTVLKHGSLLIQTKNRKQASHKSRKAKIQEG